MFSFQRDIAEFSALALKQNYQEMEKLLVEIQKALLPVEGYLKLGKKEIGITNIQTHNTLYLRMSEIYTIGKVLYKTTNPVKYDEYTFSKLIKKVRNTSSPKSKVETL